MLRYLQSLKLVNTSKTALKNTVMYVTKEPCPMCAGAIVLSRIKRVVWGMSDPKRGGAQSKFNILKDPNLNHKVDCTAGVLQMIV